MSGSVTPMPGPVNVDVSPSGVVRTALGVGLAALLLFLGGTWILPLLDRDEPRFAEASREMIERGDPVVPHLNGRYRFDKPPLIYWLQAGSILAFGPTEFAVRLPTVLCAALTAAATALWAGRLAGRGAGTMAGVMFATCLQSQIHGRIAVADMAMVLCFTTAGWAAWEASRVREGEGIRPGWAAMFFGALAAGFLAKGPVAWLPVAPAAWLWRRAVSGRRVPGPTTARLWFLGTLATWSLVAGWGVPALVATHGEFFAVGIGKHVVQRSVGVMEGHGLRGLAGYLATLPAYFLLLLPGFLPWSPWLVVRLWRSRPWIGGDVEDRYLIGGAALVFAVFTLVRTKLPHYTLPAYPLLCVWLARRLAGEAFPLPRFFRVAALAAAVVVLLTTVGFGYAARFFPVPPLAERCRPFLAVDTEVASVGFEEPSVYWYFRAHTRRYVRHLAPGEAEAFLSGTGPRLCIVSDPRLADDLTARFPDARREESSGVNVANGRRVRLAALIRGGGEN